MKSTETLMLLIIALLGFMLWKMFAKDGQQDQAVEELKVAQLKADEEPSYYVVNNYIPYYKNGEVGGRVRRRHRHRHHKR